MSSASLFEEVAWMPSLWSSRKSQSRAIKKFRAMVRQKVKVGTDWAVCGAGVVALSGIDCEDKRLPASMMASSSEVEVRLSDRTCPVTSLIWLMRFVVLRQ